MKRIADGQQGIALLLALVILLVVSIIGVAAMRTSSVSSRIAVGTQLDAMVFEAAESAIAETILFISEANQSEDSFADISALFDGDTLVWCMNSNRERISSACGTNDVMDARGTLRAEARVRSIGFSPASGNQVSMSGGPSAIIGDFQIAIQGNGSMPDYGLTNRHVQNVLRRGMIPAQEIQ